jgi:hypothetical protein
MDILLKAIYAKGIILGYKNQLKLSTIFIIDLIDD